MAKDEVKSSLRCHLCNKVKDAKDMEDAVLCKDCAKK